MDGNSRNNIIGSTEAEAIEFILNLGRKVRIWKRDGILLTPFDKSSNMDRLNLEIEKGIVVKAYHG